MSTWIKVFISHPAASFPLLEKSGILWNVFCLVLGFRTRQRHVLMESTGPAGHCPHLVESVPCEDPTCYRWLASEGICFPDHGKCGLGHRILKAVCQNDHGMTQWPIRGVRMLSISQITHGHPSIDHPYEEEKHSLFYPWIFMFTSSDTLLQSKMPWLNMGPHTPRQNTIWLYLNTVQQT